MNTNSEYFVMLNLQRGGISPMTLGEDDELALFETQEEAEANTPPSFEGFLSKKR